VVDATAFVGDLAERIVNDVIDNRAARVDDVTVAPQVVGQCVRAGASTSLRRDRLLCVVKIIGGNLAVSNRDRLMCFKKIPSESLIA
jgi:hypothetical protein